MMLFGTVKTEFFSRMSSTELKGQGNQEEKSAATRRVLPRRAVANDTWLETGRLADKPSNEGCTRRAAQWVPG